MDLKLKEIISVDAMGSVQQILSNIQEKDLLIAFDVDMTITQPNHPATFYPSLVKYKAAYKAIVEELTAEQKDMMSTLTIYQPQRLVEENIPQIIKKLQENFTVIAFTAVLAIRDVVVHRIKTLNNFGIKFSQNIADVTLRGIKAHHGHHPLLTHGILFGNGEAQGKGIVLCSFLKQLKHMPKMILVIDDKRKHLEDIKKTLQEQKIHIAFLGIEYKGTFMRHSDITEEEFKSFWRDLANKSRNENL